MDIIAAIVFHGQPDPVPARLAAQEDLDLGLAARQDVSASEVKPPQPVAKHSKSALIAAWTPWIILSVFVFIWGLPPVKAWLNSLFAPPSP